MSPLKSVYEKLEKLEQTPSTNKKVTLLKNFLEDPLFFKVVTFALDERYTFYVKDFPKFKKHKSKTSTNEIFKKLERLDAQRSATKKDKKELFKISSVNKGTYEVVRRICIKDLRCGCSTKLFNKAKPGSVAYVPYQRCSTEKKIGNITWDKGAICQEKADGTFVNVWIRSEDKINFITRNFQKVHQLKMLKQAILHGVKKTVNFKPGQRFGILNQGKSKSEFIGKVYHGELVVVKNGKVLDRKTGNGIINQCIQGTASAKDANCVTLRLWDCIPEKEFWIDHKYKIAYQTRVFNVNKFVHAVNDPSYVQSIYSKYVKSLQEAKDFYAEIRRKGREGAIVKNVDGTWKDNDGGSPDQIKMKNVSDADLRVVGWNKGEKGKKYEHLVGSIICETECGNLNVNISGLTDEQREWDWDMMIGDIVEVEYESVIKDKTGKKKHSLYLPRFICTKPDRSQADTLKQLLKR